MTDNDSKPPEQDKGSKSKRRRQNRFAKRPKTTVFVILVIFVLLMEFGSYLVILAFGHQTQRAQTKPNRQPSGYTVFKNTPNYDMSSSTIKLDPSDPDVVTNEFGFVSDEPLTIEKKPGTIRIFVLGGSGAFGAGQDQRYHSTHFYEGGVYSYPHSIAGQLKAYLSSKRTDVRFEVINAAAYRRQFHQSVLLYLESISRFNPDFVVNLEGWNDIGSLESGTPYSDAEWMLDALVQLDQKNETWLNYSNTYYVLSTAYEKFRVAGTKNEPATNLGNREFPKSKYESRKKKYIEKSARFEQTLRQYIGVVQADEAKLVFVLQPILLRQSTNKSLTKIEKKLLGVKPFGDSKKFDDYMFIANHFFDDHFSARLKTIVEEQGEIYIDGNQAIASLDDETEFFADYCHMLPAGSQTLSKAIGDAILASE